MKLIGATTRGRPAALIEPIITFLAFLAGAQKRDKREAL